jgi:acetyltransferase-like isoleucine patch superfamily enzyme
VNIPNLSRKAVSALRRLSRVAAYTIRRLYHGFLSGEDINLSSTVKLSSGVRLRATDGGTIILRSGVHLSRGVTIVAQGGFIELGDNVFVGEWSTITAKERVVLGANTLVAERVTVRDQDHDIYGGGDTPLAKAGFQVGPVLIGSNVWLAAGAVVLRGVHVGDGAVVAANAVVVEDVAANSVVGGIPAREIGSRNADTGRHD